MSDDIVTVWGPVAAARPVLSPKDIFELLRTAFPTVYGPPPLTGNGHVGSTLSMHSKLASPFRWHKVQGRRAAYRWGPGPSAKPLDTGDDDDVNDGDVDDDEEEEEEGDEEEGAAPLAPAAAPSSMQALPPPPPPRAANATGLGCSRCRFSANGCGGPNGCRDKLQGAREPNGEVPTPAAPLPPPTALPVPLPVLSPVPVATDVPRKLGCSRCRFSANGCGGPGGCRERLLSGTATAAPPPASATAPAPKRGSELETGGLNAAKKSRVSSDAPGGISFGSAAGAFTAVPAPAVVRPAAVGATPSRAGGGGRSSPPPPPAGMATQHRQQPRPSSPGGHAEQPLVEAFKRELNEHKTVQELVAHLGTLLTFNHQDETGLYSVADERDQLQLFQGGRNWLTGAVIPRPARFLTKPQFGGQPVGNEQNALHLMMARDPRAGEEGGRARLRDVDVCWLFNSGHELNPIFEPRVLIEVEHSTLKSGSGLLRLLDVCVHYKNVVCLFIVKDSDAERVRTLLRPDGAWRKVLQMMEREETARFAVIWQADLLHGYRMVETGAAGHLAMSTTQFIKEYCDHQYCSKAFIQDRRRNRNDSGRPALVGAAPAPAAAHQAVAGRGQGGGRGGGGRGR